MIRQATYLIATIPPPDQEFVMAFFPDGESGWCVGFWNAELGHWYASEASSSPMDEIYQPTHWARLPPTPDIMPTLELSAHHKSHQP